MAICGIGTKRFYQLRSPSAAFQNVRGQCNTLVALGEQAASTL
jgi:hypothetical protein